METSQEPSIYVLLRVTFGDKPSPDMASFVMLRIARENQLLAPEASKILERDRYVDDLIHSCSSTQAALQRIVAIETMLNANGFKIKEWNCSSCQLQAQLNSRENAVTVSDADTLSGVIPASKEDSISGPTALKLDEMSPDVDIVNLDREDGVKTLGVSWNPKSDTINFEVKSSSTELYTKRVVLSNISRLFDPLGLASAVTIKARIELQNILKTKKFDWDDPLPREAQQSWERLFFEIEKLKTVQFPRCFQPENPTGLPDLHVFSDASILAYGAVAYMTWPCEGRKKVRLVSAKARVAPLRQTTIPRLELMADLPPERLKVFSPPFSATGIDLFGPFFLKYGRNKKVKAWGALFTCATVRAIHLEIVEDLSSEAFFHALRRFAAHHGWPSIFISDNGTSFVGCESELKKLLHEGRKRIEEFAMVHKVKWKFNTPLSPHQGGFFETMIKQTKKALRVIIGEQVLTWNEMATVFAEVQYLVNSRPPGYPSNDVNDLQPITPNHLILGRTTADVPQGPFRETKNCRKRFEFIQALAQQFWDRFHREYL